MTIERTTIKITQKLKNELKMLKIEFKALTYNELIKDLINFYERNKKKLQS